MATQRKPELIDRYNEKALEQDIEHLDELTSREPQSPDPRSRWTQSYLRQMLRYKRERLERLRDNRGSRSAG